MSQITNSNVASFNLMGKAEELIKGLTKDQLLWLGGYLSGAALNNGQTVAVANGEPKIEAKVQPLTILVGSHTGNSKIVAQYLQESYTSDVSRSVIQNMADYNIKKLKDETNLLVVVSTHGQGEPPADAEDLHSLLNSKRAGDLSHLNFAVIALGDSSYKHFCKTGTDFHERLTKRGAKALAEPVLLDVDFQDHLESLKETTLRLFKPVVGANAPINGNGSLKVKSSAVLYQAEVLEKIKLNGTGSNKETYHIELSIEGSGFQYQPGDSLEVFGVNDNGLVEAITQKLNLNSDDIVLVKGENLSLFDALKYQRELTVVTLPVFQKLLAFASESDLNKLLDNKDELDTYLFGRDLLDVIEGLHFKLNAQELVDILRPLVPRAYSIASAQSQVGDEVHLTVGALRYITNERQHDGVCSTHIIDRLEVGDKVGVRVKSNEGFRLPEADTPMIMIGPGTGIAPFRSFIQERVDQGAKGSNWLIFGDQHFETDFLYQAEWLKYREKGHLERIDVAFSRDQEKKIYVQNRLKENAAEVYNWLERGANIYVCGDKDRMAKDVRAAFVEIIQDHAKLNKEEAEEKLAELRKSKRYQEDVY